MLSHPRKAVKFFSDITKSTEKVKISLVDETGNEGLPNFNYIPHNIIYKNANVNISLARISDEDYCCGDCLSASTPCACGRDLSCGNWVVQRGISCKLQLEAG